MLASSTVVFEAAVPPTWTPVTAADVQGMIKLSSWFILVGLGLYSSVSFRGIVLVLAVPGIDLHPFHVPGIPSSSI